VRFTYLLLSLVFAQAASAQQNQSFAYDCNARIYDEQINFVPRVKFNIVFAVDRQGNVTSFETGGQFSPERAMATKYCKIGGSECKIVTDRETFAIDMGAGSFIILEKVTGDYHGVFKTAERKTSVVGQCEARASK
jgi:hypothetical protein